MAASPLVKDHVELGKNAAKALDAASFRAPAIFWLYVSDAEEWRFVVGTPIVDSDGPRAAYAQIQKALKNTTPELPLSRVFAMSPNDALIRALRKAVPTGPGITGIRFSGNTVNNIFIEDAYIYRLN
jgi:hypothetical protein